MVAAGALLLTDLFLNWQTIELDFGPNSKVMQGQDGWDFWGLLVALLTLALLTIVAIRESDSELLLDSRWDRAPLILGSLIFVLVVVKNLRDADSAWASYVGVVLAALVAVGAFKEWSRNRSDEVHVHAAWQPQPAGPSEPPPDRRSDLQSAKW
jgi:hypothetical protein